MLSRSVALIAAALLSAGNGARIRRTSKSAFAVLSPPDASLKKVAVVMNPGGYVKAELYEESMKTWQAEAQKAGISLYVSVISYWFDLPIPIRTEAYIRRAIKQMQGAGLPKDAPVYFSGHSMGGGAPLTIVQSLYEEGVLKGAILQAAFITRSFMPPVTEEMTFTAPTLSVAAELNYGAARASRFAEAVYHQSESTQPVVMIEGMNHGQYFTGGNFEDLKPEITHEEAQQTVAEIVVDWLAKELGMGSGSLLASEVKKAKQFLQPFIAAGELEGSRSFNVPNQAGTPGWECGSRGVCDAGSPWIAECQAYIAGKDLLDSGVEIQNNFADLFPYVQNWRDAELTILFFDPFVSSRKMQAYVMASNGEGGLGDRDGKDFAADSSPFTTGELLAKFVSRQKAAKTLKGRTLALDGDLCAELNAQAYEYALRNAGEKTRKRFEAHGQKLAFDATAYQSALGYYKDYPLWVSGQMTWKEQSDGKMHVTSTGMLTGLGDRVIDGNHYCKLLSPARAMEWIYVEGLAKELKADWQ